MSSTDESPQDVYDGLTSRWKKLADKSTFEDKTRRVNWIDDQVNALSETVQTLRQRGYLFANHLETDVAAIGISWKTDQKRAQRLKGRFARELKREANDVETLLARADRRPSLFDDVERKLDAFERELDSAESKIEAPLAETAEQINTIKKVTREATELLDLLEDKSFELLPDEHPIGARIVETVGASEAEGVLFLTDKRILFEVREKRATKKRLFITVESEIVSEIRWEAPIGAVKASSAEDKGGFLGFKVKDLLLLEFADGAGDVPNPATLQFMKTTDNEYWAQELIPAAVSGKIAEQLVSVAAAEEAWDASTLPTTCPNCMAALPKIFKGMNQVTCEFCGTTVNV